MGSYPHYATMFHLRRLVHTEERGPHSKTIPSNDNRSLILLDTYVKFGRSETCDVQLTSTHGVKPINSLTNMISREHAHIVGTKSASGRIERYTVTDHSLNGTYLNEVRCRSKNPEPIKEGDIIKFGHMNGASIKESTSAPQANAEFAFVVERANPEINYMGFRDGKRAKPLICSADQDLCEEVETQRKPSSMLGGYGSGPAHIPTIPSHYIPHAPGLQLPTTTSHSTTHPNVMGLYPNLLNFGLNGFSMYQQPFVQTSGFRAPAIFGGYPTSFPGLPQAPSPASFLSRNLLAQTNPQFINQLLAPASVVTSLGGFIPGTEALLANTALGNTLFNVPRMAEEQPPPPVASNPPPPPQQQPPPQEKMASPPMECDSSVPSPPKVATSVAQTTASTPVLPSPNKTNNDDARSDTSFIESVFPVLMQQTTELPPPAVWDTPTPRHTPETDSAHEHEEVEKRTEDDKETDTESRPEEVMKLPATSTSSLKSEKVGKKNNEIARLLEETTSYVSTFKRRSSTSRRLTDEERFERIARKEKRKKEKAERAAAASSSKDGVRSKMKQLSDEESITSDSNSDDLPVPPPPKEVPKKRKAAPSESEEEEEPESDDSSKKKKKRGRKKKVLPVPKKAAASSTAKQLTPKSRWKGRAAEEEAAQSSASEEPEPVRLLEVPKKEEPCAKSPCILAKECTFRNVEWVACDDCEKWYHNFCVLGNNLSYKATSYTCGCSKDKGRPSIKPKAKKAKK